MCIQVRCDTICWSMLVPHDCIVYIYALECGLVPLNAVVLLAIVLMYHGYN
jgi:hypothetical protein